MTNQQAADIYRERDTEFQSFLMRYYESELTAIAEGETDTLTISLADIYKWDSATAHDTHTHSDLFQGVFRRAVEELDLPADMSGTRVLFTDASDPMTVEELLRGDHEGNLITLRGQVSKTSEVVPRLTTATIECQNCHNVFEITVPEHGELQLDRCISGDCSSKAINVVFDDSEWDYHQLARVRPPAEQSEGEAHIDVHLRGELAGSVSSGDRVDMDGKLNAHFEEISDPHPEFYICAHSVTHHQSDYETIETADHREEIKSYANGEYGDPYELLIDSIAPVIIDPESGEQLTKLEAVKLAVGLQLFGGWRREISAGNYVRGDSHIALIGDPSTGKSKILDSVSDLSPRSSYASGKNATKAGITAAAVRDDFGDTEWSLDAGAIVNSHKGLCCIDEIDKVSGEVVSSLHSALEKQRLEVNKAGIDATLKCETALLAAGNPEYERFVEEEPRHQQLNVDPALYSRFDLIFTLSDDPDKHNDERIARHKIKARTQAGVRAKGGEIDTPDVEPAIPKHILRAYIAHARQEVFPIIRDDAVRASLEEYHTKIRQKSSNEAPITHRKLDALLRLCEASARVRLSEEITMQDVDLVKDVVGVSLGDVGVSDGDFGEYGSIDTSTQKGRVRAITDALTGAQKSIADLSDELDMTEAAVEHEIEKLKRKGEVMEPMTGKYRAT